MSETLPDLAPETSGDAVPDRPWHATAATVALFLFVGIALPFFPVWLSEVKGLNGAEIGAVIASATYARLLAGPALGVWAEASGTRRVLIFLSLVLVAGCLAFFFASAFVVLFLIGLFALTAQAAFMPLADAALLRETRSGRPSYGLTRSIGSAAFIFANIVGGVILARTAPDYVLYMLMGSAVLMLLSSIALPVRRVPPVVGAPKSFLARLKAGFGLFKSRHILLMTLACALLQGSHAFYYGFASIIWRDQGIADTVIGPLWSVGVLFEVALLALSARLFAGWSAAALFLLGGVGGLVRWTAMAFTPDLALLIPLQAVHALTFAATHLALLRYIQTHLAPGQVPFALSMITAVAFGPALGFAMVGSGFLYDAVGAFGYLAMSAMSALGIGLTYALMRADAKASATA
jgi:MFS transporter, PPP family, 3-phenylpropionic acid transporter